MEFPNNAMEIVEDQESLRRENERRNAWAACEEVELYRRMWDAEAPAEEGGNST